MALIAPQAVVITGVAANFVAAAAGGDNFVPDTNGVFLIRNGGAGPITATVVIPGLTSQGQPIPDVAVVVAAGATAAIGPFPADDADPVTKQVSVTYSAVVTVTVAYLSV